MCPRHTTPDQSRQVHRTPRPKGRRGRPRGLIAVGFGESRLVAARIASAGAVAYNSTRTHTAAAHPTAWAWAPEFPIVRQCDSLPGSAAQCRNSTSATKALVSARKNSHRFIQVQSPLAIFSVCACMHVRMHARTHWQRNIEEMKQPANNFITFAFVTFVIG